MISGVFGAERSRNARKEAQMQFERAQKTAAFVESLPIGKVV
jgi:hypothetical protein